ncbi:MAG: hypothetical protein Q8L95_04545 [Burkholderiales bacterium]|nr:hypothetical protein [Burkholderiales bacterium]
MTTTTFFRRVLAAALLCAAPAHAATLTLTPAADAYVQAGSNAARNYGSATTLRVGTSAKNPIETSSDTVGVVPTLPFNHTSQNASGAETVPSAKVLPKIFSVVLSACFKVWAKTGPITELFSLQTHRRT